MATFMRVLAVTFVSLSLAICLGAQTPADTAAPATKNAAVTAPAASQPTQSSEPAGPVGTPIVSPESPRELAEAKRQFDAGVKLKSSGKLDDAFKKFEAASELNPHSVDYLTAREFTRQELVLQALERGNQAMANHNEVVAMAEFRRAVEYDPANDFALQRLHDSIPEDATPSQGMRVLEQSSPIQLQPTTEHHDFHYRGDARTLLTQLAQTYGLTAEFDDSVQQRRVYFDIEDVNFATAMDAASRVTKTFWIPLSARQMFVAADTVENRRTFERMVLRTFYLPEIVDPQLTEMMNSLRVLLNIRFIGAEKSQSTITVRAEEPLVEAAARILESLTSGRPEVLLDVRVYEVSSSLARQIGTTLPTQFTMFNLSPALLAGLGAGAQNLINQLIASGGINQANSTAIQALLAQLANQSNSLLQQPFATFGGGKTLFGLTAGGVGVTPTLNLNESDVRDLEHVTLRASQNNLASLHIGERYPIVNATFAPIYNSTSIAQVIGNKSYIAPFPSIQYEDLGINMKATPSIHGDRDVTLKLELQIRSLGAQTNNGIPIINNSEYSGDITLKNGESGVVAGLISKADARSIDGYPFLSRVPGLSYAASLHDKNVQDSELLVVITPHIVSMSENNSFAMQLPSGQ